MSIAAHIGILIACAACGYIVGMINPAFIIAKIRGFDIREFGTGNAGGSNAMVVMGRPVGVCCILFDVFKMTFVMCAAARALPIVNFAPEAAAFGCFAGHIFPAYMRFRGGKGTACLAGAMLYYSFFALLVMLVVVAVIIAFAGGYGFFGSIFAGVMVPVWVAVVHDPYAALFLVPPCIVLIVKHLPNLRHKAEGTEYKVSAMKNRDAENARVASMRNAAAAAAATSAAPEEPEVSEGI